MVQRYHVGQCPMCRQGRLFLFRNSATADIYGHCEECEQGFLKPDDLRKNGGFLTLQDDTEAEWATAEEVGRSVWANYRHWAVDEP